ncbi:alpha/beta hydrolase family protein, partial [Acidobacteriota bacterium]
MKMSLPSRLFLVCFLVFALSVSVESQKPPSFADPGEKGPYEIGFTSFLIMDSSRNTDIGGRPIPVYFWYPVDPSDINAVTPEAIYPLDPLNSVVPPTSSSDWEAYGFDKAYQEPPVSTDGPFPLLLFSPGWGGPAWGHLNVGTRLASHGIAVAVTYHWGDGFWPWEPLDHLAVASMNRPLDISFMLTHLLAMNGTPGELIFNSINPNHVAASGWSLGGYAAMALAGGDDSVCDKFPSLGFPNPPPETCVPALPDPRISAIVTLDGSTQLLYFNELARIDVPTMGIGQEWSTLDMLSGEEFASLQARLHAASQGHPCYRVDLAEAYHHTFSNHCEAASLL